MPALGDVLRRSTEQLNDRGGGTQVNKAGRYIAPDDRVGLIDQSPIASTHVQQSRADNQYLNAPGGGESTMERFRRFGSMRRETLVDRVNELSARMSDTLRNVGSVVSA